MVGTVESSAFTAERVAEALRLEVMDGTLGADDRIKDQDLAQRFAVSRNTAREALRLVASEGLVVLRLHSGAAVRRLQLDDVCDIYRVRRTMEYSAVMASSRSPEPLFGALADSVARAEKYAGEQLWAQAATASAGVHTAIVALLGSTRMSKFFEQQMAQLRLASWALPIASELQESWIPRDREIVDLILGGHREQAALELLHYLDDSEANVVDSIRAAARTVVHT